MKLPAPSRLGLPQRFVEWRRQQEVAILDLIEGETRFDGLQAPTGSGKSLIALGLAQLLPDDERILILTSTKALQDQYVDTAYEMGLRDVRGKSNYKCVAASPGGQFASGEPTSRGRDDSFISIEHAPCYTEGVQCSLQLGGCTWFDALRAARGARVVSTNYAKWISTPADVTDEALGKFTWLICDEAAEAEKWVTSAMHVDLRKADVDELLRLPWPSRETGIGTTRLSDWVEWARRHRPHTDAALRMAEAQVKDMRAAGRRVTAEQHGRLVGTRRVCEAMSGLRTISLKAADSAAGWVHDTLYAYGRPVGVMFDPVWPAAHTESLLFRGIPRIVLMGATLVPKHLDLLGVPVGERRFTTYPSTFAVARRPIIYCKLQPPLKLNYTAEADERVRARVCEIGDALTSARLDRRGIWQAVSYKRARWLTAGSIHRDILITHAADSASTRAAVKRFRESPPPVVINSPSLDTGWDFPGEDAEWCWIPKLPFEPDSALMRARKSIDPTYPDFVVADRFSQMCGRGMRAAWDSFETIVTDAQFAWHPWAKSNRELYPQYVLAAIRTVEGLPRPLPKLKPTQRGP